MIRAKARPREINYIQDMQHTVYYLAHRDTGERFRYYRSLAGARIAQRSRNSRLGFEHRVERVEQFANWEVELCLLADGTIVEATYCIVEDTIDSVDLIDEDLLSRDCHKQGGLKQ